MLQVMVTAFPTVPTRSVATMAVETSVENAKQDKSAIQLASVSLTVAVEPLMRSVNAKTTIQLPSPAKVEN